MTDYAYPAYAEDVAAQRIPTGPYARMAAERYLRMRERADRMDGYRFNSQAAHRAIAWFPRYLRIPTMERYGRFHLSPYQQFIVANLIGFEVWDKRAGHWHRQFRYAYTVVARKNGKTTFGAGFALYMAFGDREPAPQVYFAAVDGKQAREGFEMAGTITRESPHMAYVDVHVNRIRLLDTSARIQVIAKNPRAADGKIPHLIVCDEFNLWDRQDMWDVLYSSMRARKQPLLLTISYAGKNRAWVGRGRWNFCARILRRQIENDRWFALMFEIGQDESDWDPKERDLFSEAEWIKTNPNAGISVSYAALETEALAAKQDPDLRPEYYRTTLCMWTTALQNFVLMDLWRRSGRQPIPDLAGRPCYGAIDISKYDDLSACVLVFPPVPGDPHFYVQSQCWIPGDTLQERVAQEGAPYGRWHEDGIIAVTPGPVIDYSYIVDYMHACKDVYDLREISYDPRYALDITAQLIDAYGQEFCYPFRQTFVDFVEPVLQTERLYKSLLLAHGNDEVLNYCAQNVQVERDAQENPMLRKGRHDRFQRIDAFVALAMAVGAAKRAGYTTPEEPPPERIVF